LAPPDARILSLEAGCHFRGNGEKHILQRWQKHRQNKYASTASSLMHLIFLSTQKGLSFIIAELLGAGGKSWELDEIYIIV